MSLPHTTPELQWQREKARADQLAAENEALRQNVDELATQLAAEREQYQQLSLYYPLRVAERDEARSELRAARGEAYAQEELVKGWRAKYNRLYQAYRIISEIVRIKVPPQEYHSLRMAIVHDINAGQPIGGLPDPNPTAVPVQTQEVQP